MKRTTTLTLAFMLCLMLILSGFASTIKVELSQEEYDLFLEYKKLIEVHQYVEEFYYKQPDEKKLMDGAIQGLLSGLGDNYSFYFNEEEWEKLWEEDEGVYAGIGVQMLGDWRDGSVTITRVFKGTPAEEAGLKKGDVFYMTEDLVVTTETMKEAVSIMRGEPGEKVTVQVIRDFETLTFELTKAMININRMEYTMLDDEVGYIAAYEFAGKTLHNEVKAALNELEKQGAKALVFDLRDNPGGWVDQAINIADLFLDKCLLFYTEDRKGDREQFFSKKGKTDIPLVVLVNENSASSIEIFAGAMQDWGRGVIVGENTFGKGIIQSVTVLSDMKTGFQFTTAQYFTPKGRQVHEKGIVPNVESLWPEGMDHPYYELGDLSDPQLKAAFEEAKKLVK